MDGFEFVCSHRALKTDDYYFDLEEYRRGQDVLLAAHIRFDRFTPSVMKTVLKQWRVFRQCVTAPIVAIGEEDNEKWERFVSLLGFRPVKEITCINGKQRRLFIHTISDGNV